MRRAIASLFLVGVIVMAYCGRSTWMSGGGVVMPHLSTSGMHTPTGPVLRITNTGKESLQKIEVATDCWNLDRRLPVCGELGVGQEVSIALPPEVEGKMVYVFAARYPLLAWFDIPTSKKSQ